ncbi:MAG TPA: NAD-dependent epimerase/dehydratase family protein [Polyangia bacterium]
MTATIDASDQPGDSPIKAALVTGASGFLGSRLVATLCRRGVKVRALVRATSDLHRLHGLDAEIVHGDVCLPESLHAAAAGQQVVFHVAAKVPDWGSRREFFRVNADGTSEVVAACQAAGVERLVHISSLTVLGLPRQGAAVDEQSPYDASPRDAYTASKIEAERTVRKANGQRGLSTVAIRPGAIWGPGDPSIAPRMAALLRQGRAVYIGRASNSLALSHVDNLTAGLLLAAVLPAAAGQIYHLTDGEAVTARMLIDALAATLGTKTPRFSVPFPAMYLAAALLEGMARLARRRTPPPFTRYGVRLVSSDCLYNNDKAERELGYRASVSLREGLAALTQELNGKVVSRATNLHDGGNPNA